MDAIREDSSSQSNAERIYPYVTNAQTPGNVYRVLHSSRQFFQSEACFHGLKIAFGRSDVSTCPSSSSGQRIFQQRFVVARVGICDWFL